MKEIKARHAVLIARRQKTEPIKIVFNEPSPDARIFMRVHQPRKKAVRASREYPTLS
jgi:hypothetical protein